MGQLIKCFLKVWHGQRTRGRGLLSFENSPVFPVLSDRNNLGLYYKY